MSEGSLQQLLLNFTELYNLANRGRGNTSVNVTLPSLIFPLIDANSEGFAVLAGCGAGFVLVVVFWVVWRASLSVPVKQLPASRKKWKGTAHHRDGERSSDDEAAADKKSADDGNSDSESHKARAEADADEFDGEDTWQRNAERIGASGQHVQHHHHHHHHKRRSSVQTGTGGSNAQQQQQQHKKRHSRQDSSAWQQQRDRAQRVPQSGTD